MIKGFAARKTPPESIEPARKPIPCPKCQRPVEQWPDEDVEAEGLDPDTVTILGCGACQQLSAHVAGVADVWRECKKSEDLDVVIADAHDGLRQKHFIESDASDPMWSQW